VNILVVKPSSFGDIVHAFPAVGLLRQHVPDATIAWVTNAEYVALVELLPGVDERILFDRKRWGRARHWHELAGFLRDIRQREYDLVLDFQGLLRSAIITRVSGGLRRLGFRSAREGAPLFYTDRVLLPANLKHAVDKNVFLVQYALNTEERMTLPDLRPARGLDRKAETLCARNSLTGPVLAVAPATRWDSKMWPAEKFAEVIDEVCRQAPEVTCWLAGTSSEREIGEAVVKACQTASPCNLMGETDCGLLAAMLARSNAVLTNDSGPMHLAAALKVPTVALFGPTDPELTGPYGDGHAVFRGTCPDMPCFAGCCPRRGGPTCLTDIDANEVAKALLKRLRK